MSAQLETIRSLLTDVDALASAAAESLDRLPHLPRSAPEEVRLSYGRLQSLVAATADACEKTLLACVAMLDEREGDVAVAVVKQRG